MAIRDRIDRGEEPGAAERNVRRELGSEALIKETTREMWGWGALDRWRQDLHYSARVLGKGPGFTLQPRKRDHGTVRKSKTRGAM